MDRPITVIVSNNARRFEFDLTAIPAYTRARGATCVAEAKTWVESIIQMEGVDRFKHAYRIELNWPEVLETGVTFSSAPDLDIAQALEWHYRVDAQVEGDLLVIFVYKRFQHIQGGYQDGSKWFSDEFRQLVHDKAVQEGMSPARR